MVVADLTTPPGPDAVTFAPGMTAPDSSATCPLRIPSDCAKAAIERLHRSAHRASFLSIVCFLLLLCSLLLRRHSYIEAPRSEIYGASLSWSRGANGLDARHDRNRQKVQAIGSVGAGNNEGIAGFQFSDGNLGEA